MSLRENVEQTCNDLSERAMQLQRLMALYSGSNRAVQALADSKEGQPLMIPLTESVYVPAKVADTGRVLVDVGTGYFVHMSADGASDFCRRKSAKLEETLKSVSGGLNEKRRALAQIEEVLAFKMMAAQQQQQQQQQKVQQSLKGQPQPSSSSKQQQAKKPAAATVG